MYKKLASIFLAVILALSLFACTSAPATESATQESGAAAAESATDAPEAVPEDIKVAVAVPDDPGTFTFLSAMGSEAYAVIVNQVYDPLFDYGVDFEVTPLIATSWDKVDDLTYIFHLREGVKFADGSLLKASDVLFSFVKASEDPAASQATAGIDFANTKVIDDSTIQVVFTNSYIVNFINISQIRIASEAAYNSSEDGLITTTCGTGAFTLKEYKPGSSIVLEQNPNYWGEKPVITEIELKVIPDAAQRANALLAGDVDIIMNASYSDLDTFKADSNFEVTSSVTHKSSSVFFNTTENSVCQNVNLRQAICYAIDKAGILSAVYSGYGEVAVGPFTTKFKDFDPAYVADGYYDFNMEQAKATLAESGVAAGTPVKIICSGASIDAPAAQIIQASLNELGLSAEIVSYDPAVYFGTMMDPTGGWDVALQLTGCPSGLGGDLINAFVLHLGISGYKSDALVEEVNELLTKGEIADMAPATARLYETMLSDVPIFSMVQVSTNYAYSARITDFILWNQANMKFADMKAQ